VLAGGVAGRKARSTARCAESEKANLTNGVDGAADVKSLLDQVRRSKKKSRSR
jgi:hypothetical protein